MRVHALDDVTPASVVGGWDANATSRLAELLDNHDPAYRALTHYIVDYLERLDLPGGATVLDVGCGLGFLSGSLSNLGYTVVGVDPSIESIAIAREVNGRVGGPTFHAATLQEYSRATLQRFDVMVANMTLHSVEHLTSFMVAAERLLSDGGVLIATIPNPAQYLQTRDDLDLRDLDLNRDNTISIPFRIRNHDPHPSPVVFFHRPVRSYSVAADKARLRIDDFAIPDQIGPGRARDVALIAFRRYGAASLETVNGRVEPQL